MLRKGNNMRRVLLIIITACSILVLGADAAPIQPEADKAYEALYKVLKEYGISGAAQANYNLRVTHKTNKFMIHTIHKTGYISPKPVEIEGPNYDGLIVEAQVRMGKYGGQGHVEATAYSGCSFVVIHASQPLKAAPHGRRSN